jgi:hypothetical protein
MDRVHDHQRWDQTTTKPNGHKHIHSPEPSATSNVIRATTNTGMTGTRTTTPPPPQKRARIYEEQSPTTSCLVDALCLQRPPTAKEVQSLCKSYMFVCCHQMHLSLLILFFKSS